MSVVIKIEAVTKRFGSVVAVDGVSLDILENEFIALLGASGCGKTTLLRIMAGLEHPDGGRVLIDGKDMTDAPPYARPVNMMFQSYALFPHMTAAGNVAFGLKQDGLSGAALEARVKEALAAVELGDLGDRRPDQLSGGQRQRVALARCIAKRPRVLLLDEPLAALDKHLRERTQLELMALRARLGITFVVVTHDQSEAMAMADRIAVRENGRILQVDTPRSIYERPANARVAGFFGDINLWPGVVGGQPGVVYVSPLGLELRVGRPLSPGTSVSIALRPEHVVISRSHLSNRDHTVTGTVQGTVYLGSASTCFVKTAAGGIVRVLAPHREDGPVFGKGEAVHLSWSAAAITVLDT